MTRNMVGAWDGGLEVRANAASVGLQVVRVATAAARLREGSKLNERDKVALRRASEGFRQEARVLRHEAAPETSDETAYAFAGVTLTAARSTETSHDTVAAATTLDHLAADLERMYADEALNDDALSRIETLFFRANELVSQRIGRNGETLEGQDLVSLATA